MFERIKTFVLALLVLLSLLQTYVLVYRTPQFEQAEQSGYVQTEKAETLLEVEQLLMPRMIVAHLGEQAHTIFYPQTPEYDNMVQSWRQFTYEALQKTDMTLEQFYEERDTRLGLSLHFAQDMDLPTLQSLFQMTNVDDLKEKAPVFDLLFASPDENEEKMHVWFVSQSKRQIYKSSETDMTQAEFTEMMVNTSLQPIYRTYAQRHFIPEQPLPVRAYTLARQKVEAAPLWQRLFIDPNITRNLTERDGTQIFTDGKRGLQIKNNGLYMLFSDPVAQQNYSGSLLESLRHGTQFINKHGGWSGKYLLHSMRKVAVADESVYEFRQYYKSLPLMHPEEDWFGYTRLKMKSGTVAGYQRPMIELSDQQLAERQVTLLAGSELATRLEQLAGDEALRIVAPVYKVSLQAEQVRLQPVWGVLTERGKWIWLQ